MCMDFKTFEKILTSSGWGIRCSTTTTGAVRFFKGGLETFWFDCCDPVTWVVVVDRTRYFRSSIHLSRPRTLLGRTLADWLSQVETEYKLFCL